MKRTTLPRVNASDRSGHLPYIVAEAVLNTIPAEPAPAPSQAEEAARVTQKAAAEVLAKHPELAAKLSIEEFAEIVRLSIREHVEEFKPTAAERGSEWMTRYGCPAWCVMDHAGKDREPGWHQGAAIAMDPPPLQDDEREPGDVAPFLSARINQNSESPDLFGIETRLWLDINDNTHELGLRETDRFIERMENFLPRLKAMRDRLAEAGRDDRPRNEKAFQAWLATPLTLRAGE
ncbi:DUF6907 domain-containing protein [Streptomyces sp. cmx-10-25]|uniref:DUF6907 domain-containing protein n=1 Tax=Streptomyces sp. cmx-10-25 TaxID=2790919 RepID=UPI003980FE96